MKALPRRAAPNPAIVALSTLVLLAGLGGCTYSGQIDDPYTWKVTWFSYLNGDDVRERCANIDKHWEVRLIYNGQYEKQVRTYHLVADGTGGADVVARANKTQRGVLRFTLDDPLAPWRWEKSRTRLSPEMRDELSAQLADAGVWSRAPSGLRLKSWGSYWISIACRNGELFYNAWTYSSERWDRQDLRQIVEPLDATGVAFYQPHKPKLEDSPAYAQARERSGSVHFEMITGNNGLAGLP